MSVLLPLPMFPLGTVAVPGSVVPLHVFEPRYRQLVEDLETSDRRFGIVLIERGSEVGGGDVRASVGTRMRLAESQLFPDGRYAIVAVGEERVRIETWLPDDPYPLALVETLVDDAEPSSEAVEVAERSVRRAHALAQELGYEVPSLDDFLVGDPIQRLWQLARMTPCGPVDRQRILAAESVEARADAVAAAALDAAEMFALRRDTPE
ncbi:MAG: LON peptidase substrate-binding domain-containing protein [Acidimicrobiales bacterium]|nr:LON peptidase substrate-binding domain-containing protein [Acidimicrobiales bacterium]